MLWLLLVGLLIALLAPRALAHGDVVEITADAKVAPVGISAEGVVQRIAVDDETTKVHQEYALLVSSSGRYLLTGARASGLANGGSYRVAGTTRGRALEIETASRTVQTGAKSMVTVAPLAVEGTLRLGHIDYTDRPSEFFFAVFSVDGAHRQLPGAELLGALANGMEVSAFGSVDANGTFVVEHIVVHRHADVALAGIHTKAAATHSLFIVPVKFPSNRTAPFTYPADPFTTASLNTAVFAAAPAKSIVAYYKEVSYGQQTLTGVTASPGGQWLKAMQPPPVDTNGKATCDTDFIQTQGTAAAKAAGYSSTQLNPTMVTAGSTGPANHVVFVFTSTGFQCGWAGLAYIGYGLAFVNQTSSISVIGHELGHTFGLYHAGSLRCGSQSIGGTCSVAEYGDPYDIMGNSSAMHFNAFQKQVLNWIAPSAVSTHTGGTATYTLTPIEAPGGSQYAVRIPAGPSRTYWLEYRQPLGFDSGISAANANGAQIRVARPLETTCSGCDAYSDDTELVDMTPGTSSFVDAALAPGSRFVDNYYGLAVDVLSATASALTVRVSALGKGIAPDFDANGTTDLVVRNSATGQTIAWLMNGVVAAPSNALQSDPNWKVVRAGDLNGDGKSDLIWQNNATGQTSVGLMNGASVSSSSILSSDANWTVQAVGDFNGDGRDDLVWRNSANGQTAIWLMNGASTISAATILRKSDWIVQNVGDFNGDGQTDLVWRNTSTGQTAIWLMNGVSATEATIILSKPDWTVKFTGDFDGDGKSDLLWYNSATGESAIWLMNGTASKAAVYAGPGTTWTPVQVGDFDGDGKTDILWRSITGATQMWLMNGAVPTATATLTPDPNMSAVKIGDFDGDGKADIAWRNASTGQTIIWLMNGLTTVNQTPVQSDPNWSIQLPN
jgi:hypothetical protein